MKAPEVPTAEWIERMKSTHWWKRRDLFQVGDMAMTLGCQYETIGNICRSMHQDGLIERIATGSSVQWRAPVPNILSIRWDAESLGRVL